jgi:hypothetical protein
MRRTGVGRWAVTEESEHTAGRHGTARVCRRGRVLTALPVIHTLPLPSSSFWPKLASLARRRPRAHRAGRRSPPPTTPPPHMTPSVSVTVPAVILCRRRSRTASQFRASESFHF